MFLPAFKYLLTLLTKEGNGLWRTWEETSKVGSATNLIMVRFSPRRTSAVSICTDSSSPLAMNPVFQAISYSRKQWNSMRATKTPLCIAKSQTTTSSIEVIFRSNNPSMEPSPPPWRIILADQSVEKKINNRQTFLPPLSSTRDANPSTRRSRLEKRVSLVRCQLLQILHDVLIRRSRLREMIDNLAVIILLSIWTRWWWKTIRDLR